MVWWPQGGAIPFVRFVRKGGIFKGETRRSRVAVAGDFLLGRRLAAPATSVSVGGAVTGMLGGLAGNSSDSPERAEPAQTHARRHEERRGGQQQNKRSEHTMIPRERAPIRLQDTIVPRSVSIELYFTCAGQNLLKQLRRRRPVFQLETEFGRVACSMSLSLLRSACQFRHHGTIMPTRCRYSS